MNISPNQALHRFTTTHRKEVQRLHKDRLIETAALSILGYYNPSKPIDVSINNFFSQNAGQIATVTCFAGRSTRWIESVAHAKAEGKATDVDATGLKCFAPVFDVRDPSQTVPLGFYALRPLKGLGHHIIVRKRTDPKLDEMVEKAGLDKDDTEYVTQNDATGHGSALKLAFEQCLRGKTNKYKYIITNFSGDVNSRRTIKTAIMVLAAMTKISTNESQARNIEFETFQGFLRSRNARKPGENPLENLDLRMFTGNETAIIPVCHPFQKGGLQALGREIRAIAPVEIRSPNFINTDRFGIPHEFQYKKAVFEADDDASHQSNAQLLAHVGIRAYSSDFVKNWLAFYETNRGGNIITATQSNEFAIDAIEQMWASLFANSPLNRKLFHQVRLLDICGPYELTPTKRYEAVPYFIAAQAMREALEHHSFQLLFRVLTQDLHKQPEEAQQTINRMFQYGYHAFVPREDLSKIGVR